MGFTYTPPPIPLGRAADLLIAAEYTGKSGAPWKLLPHIQPIAINWYEGSRPPDARFRYVQGYPGQDEDLPVRMETVFPLDAQGTGVIQTDTRVGVFRMSSTGLIQLIFDGFTQAPGVDINEETESLTFVAFGTPVREWDTILGQAIYRQAQVPKMSNRDARVKLRSRFNPDGHPNATPDGNLLADEGSSYRDDQDGEKWVYPVFLGPVWPDNEIRGATLRHWTLDMAARHIVANAASFSWVRVSWTMLVDVLRAAVPTTEDGNIDWRDTRTYTLKPIIVQDIDVSGMAWPAAMETLIQPHGFGMSWRLDQDDDGEPRWWLDVYRLDKTIPVKQLYLQTAGEDLEPASTNIGAMQLSRDSHAIANAIHVDTALVRVEVSVILAPNFEILATDADNLETFNRVDGSAPEAGTKKYREFVFDEAAEGHWNLAEGEFDDNPLPPEKFRKKVLNSKAVIQKRLLTDSLVRRRKPLNSLCTLGDDGEPLKAQLDVSFDYGRVSPWQWRTDDEGERHDPTDIWDGSGTWDSVSPSCWSLLENRIGIVFTVDDVNAIPAGERVSWSELGGPWEAAWSGLSPIERNNGLINLVEWLATPGADGASTDAPVFRLTFAFDADHDLRADANTMGMSPTKYRIQRQMDATTRFRRHVVSRYSALNPNNDNANGKDEIVLDDLDDALAMAATTARVHQNAVFGGSVTIPRVTTAYRVGDKISEVIGRGISLATNTGLAQGASPIYPSVVALSIDNDGRQSTTIHLSDRRAEYAPMRSHPRRPGFIPRVPVKHVRGNAIQNRGPQ